MNFFEEFPFLIPFLSIILAFGGFILTFYYFRKQAKDKEIENKRDNDLRIEQAVLQKQREERTLAIEIKDENKRLAVDVKESMVNHMSHLVNTLKQDIELQKTILLSEINLMKQTDNQITKDLQYFVHNQQTVNERMQKSIDFMNQFLWGAGAKSTPPFVEGEEESQEHKDKPPEGIFMSPDSTETQAMKDKNLDSRKSKGVKDAEDYDKLERKQKYGDVER